MKKNSSFRWSLLLFACLMLVITFVLVFRHQAPADANLALPPSISPFKHSVSGIGIVEAETIHISTAFPEIIKNIYVTSGQKIKKNALLFKIDDDSIKAQLQLAKAQLESVKIAASEAHMSSKLTQAKIKEAEAAINILSKQIEKLTVRAPSGGTVLQVNAKAGEYAQIGMPIVLLADTDHLTVRVEIDEIDAQAVTQQAQAVAVLRGDTTQRVPLVFLKKEPLVLAKKYLSGQGDELADTRVVQFIYRLDNAQRVVQVGQRVDVYIETDSHSSDH